MSIAFQATIIDISTPRWGIVVTLSADYEEDAEEERYVTLQRKDEYTRQDVDLGMNGVHIECCGQGWSWYGHIESVALSRDRLDIVLDKEAAEHMFNDGRIEVGFSVDFAKYLELKTALRRVFHGLRHYNEFE
jgi:hypothetical protein